MIRPRLDVKIIRYGDKVTCRIPSKYHRGKQLYGAFDNIKLLPHSFENVYQIIIILN